MANQQLVDYINQQLQQGVDKEEIKKTLLANNWQEGDISEAFNQGQVLIPFNKSDKPQKSQFWIWTTLWLTTILDSALVFFVFYLALAFIAQAIKFNAIVVILYVVARVLSLWLGAYLAVKYVLKKSLIFKRDANKLAVLTIVVPVVGSILLLALSSLNFTDLVINLASIIITLGIIYYSVKSLIIKYGSE